MRYQFGGTPADFVVAPGQQVQVGPDTLGATAVLIPGARLWVWDPDTGDRLTDLMDHRGEPVAEITADSSGAVPRFRAPDEVKRVLVGQAPDTSSGDAGEHSRHLLASTDWPADVTKLNTRITALENTTGGDDGGGDYVATAHPMMWHMGGPLESRRSPHPYHNLEGRNQTIIVLRAQATITEGTIGVRVVLLDPDTRGGAVAASVTITPEEPWALIRPQVEVSDGTGVTVEVDVPEEAEAEDLTVQVTIR
ncbi:hypothetical protein HNR23_002221 [Nocardiopsis mwathae]|uniref:Uncharacterized protein n=1 Tax=Nocardiopsis mwathae TaxID=1472723 RepID=A0A7X0D5Y8_9ACTN|nr:hypothetical protein [Nocardiopsis mwathae]MBB6172161.1 hypothetical protein [Nocardiopsis mwathae]